MTCKHECALRGYAPVRKACMVLTCLTWRPSCSAACRLYGIRKAPSASRPSFTSISPRSGLSGVYRGTLCMLGAADQPDHCSIFRPDRYAELLYVMALGSPVLFYACRLSSIFTHLLFCFLAFAFLLLLSCFFSWLPSSQ